MLAIDIDKRTHDEHGQRVHGDMLPPMGERIACELKIRIVLFFFHVVSCTRAVLCRYEKNSGVFRNAEGTGSFLADAGRQCDRRGVMIRLTESSSLADRDKSVAESYRTTAEDNTTGDNIERVSVYVTFCPMTFVDFRLLLEVSSWNIRHTSEGWVRYASADVRIRPRTA